MMVRTLSADSLADGALTRQGITSAQWSPDERYLATKHESFPSSLALKALPGRRAFPSEAGGFGNRWPKNFYRADIGYW